MTGDNLITLYQHQLDKKRKLYIYLRALQEDTMPACISKDETCMDNICGECTKYCPSIDDDYRALLKEMNDG